MFKTKNTRKLIHEGQPVFICWDLWFEVLHISRHRERIAPLDHFGAIHSVTEHVFYN